MAVFTEWFYNKGHYSFTDRFDSNESMYSVWVFTLRRVQPVVDVHRQPGAEVMKYSWTRLAQPYKNQMVR